MRRGEERTRQERTGQDRREQSKGQGSRRQYCKTGSEHEGDTGIRNGERASPEGPKEDIYSKSLSSGSELAAYFK